MASAAFKYVPQPTATTTDDKTSIKSINNEAIRMLGFIIRYIFIIKSKYVLKKHVCLQSPGV